MGIKRDKYDAVISDLVRERDDWTCTKCSKYYPEGMRQGLHASHIWSRANKSTRWHPPAIVSHCYFCHNWYSGNPIDSGQWARNYLGEGLYDILHQRKSKPLKYTKFEKDEMYQHYKNELKRLQGLRKQGVTGYIEVVSYD